MGKRDYAQEAEEAQERKDAYINFALAMFSRLKSDIDREGTTVNEYLCSLNVQESSRMSNILEIIGQKDQYNKYSADAIEEAYDYMKQDIFKVLKKYIILPESGADESQYKIINKKMVYEPSPLYFLESFKGCEGLTDHAKALGVSIDKVRSYRYRHPQWMKAITGGEGE